MNDKIGFNCKDIITWLGFKPDRHKGKINDQIYQLVIDLQNKDFLKLENKLSYEGFCKATLNSIKFYPQSSFALINYDEIDKLADFKNYISDTNRMTSSILFLVLSFIRLKMLRRTDIQTIKNKPEIYYRNISQIAIDIDISSRQVSNAIKILNQLDIIYSEELPRYQDKNKKWHSNVTIFVNKYKYIDKQLVKDYDYLEELKYGKKFITENLYNKKNLMQEIT